MFILTAVGYLIALTIAYAPVPALDSLRMLGRAALIAIALAATVAYVVLGFYDTLGWVDKAIESALILAVIGDIAISHRKSN